VLEDDVGAEAGKTDKKRDMESQVSRPLMCTLMNDGQGMRERSRTMLGRFAQRVTAGIEEVAAKSMQFSTTWFESFALATAALREWIRTCTFINMWGMVTFIFYKMDANAKFQGTNKPSRDNGCCWLPEGNGSLLEHRADTLCFPKAPVSRMIFESLKSDRGLVKC
jgi:hypothetical protein